MMAKKKGAPKAKVSARGGAAALSHWVDETPPDLDRSVDGTVSVREELIRAGIDAHAFGSWLTQQLGTYRGSQHVKANVLQRSEEVDFLDGLSAEMSVLSNKLVHGEIPWRADAALKFVAHRDGTNWHELCDRLSRDLTLSLTLLGHVRAQLGARPAKRGPKQKHARNALLGAIVDRLTEIYHVEKTPARILALKILRACGIEAPSPDQKVPEKSAARTEKRSHN